MKPIQLMGLFAIPLLACLALGTLSGGAVLGVIAASVVAEIAAMVHPQSALNNVWQAAGSTLAVLAARHRSVDYLWHG